MRLLLDANLSWRMASVLKQHFDDCFHVDSVGLTVPAKDSEIWDYARKNDLIIGGKHSPQLVAKDTSTSSPSVKPQPQAQLKTHLQDTTM